MVPALWYEHHDVRPPGSDASDDRPSNLTFWKYRYYIVYVFEGAGLTGRRTNLIADVSYSLRYALYFSLNASALPNSQYNMSLMSLSRVNYS